MKKVFVFLCLLFAIAAHAQKLAEFNLNSYQGWTYTRSSVDLNTSNISTNKINLYGDYMLVSPLFSAQNVNYVKAQIRIVSKNYVQDKYSYLKASPTLQLLDVNGTVVSTVLHYYSEPLLEQNIEAYLPVPEGSQMLSFRISVPSGDVNSTGAVREVTLTASATDGKVFGDVNGDGVCDVTDVTTVVNIILGLEVSTPIADVNQSGTIDVSDVTTIINQILS
ncbi:MAG: dockerin type I repeat-containing protein [Sodaliphilus sp.]